MSIKITFQKIIIQGTVFLLILLWSYSSLSKLIDLKQFEKILILQQFSVIEPKFLKWPLPFAELACAVLLIFDGTRKTGLYLSACMLASFTFYVALASFGYWRDAPCACGGILSSMPWGIHLYFNLFFIAINLVPMILGGKPTLTNLQKQEINQPNQNLDRRLTDEVR